MTTNNNTHICPQCGQRLVERKRRSDGKPFWGCSGFPKCRFAADNPPGATQGSVLQAAKVFKPSAYQQAVFDFVQTGVGNAFVEAVAGSGKTTTIVQALQFTRGRVAFFAFNKSIANELKTKAPAHVNVQTLHGHGYAAIRNAHAASGYGSLDMDDNKKWNIAETLLPDVEADTLALSRAGVAPSDPVNYKYQRSILVRLTSLVQSTLTNPFNREAVDALIDHYDIEVNGSEDLIKGLLPAMIKACAEQTQVIDYDDMNWMPVFLNLPIAKYDWVYVDEAQDLNAVQIELVLRSVADGGRIVCVGDRNQSIYGFRGADVRAVPNIINATQAISLPLSICYRCPKSHVELAQGLVPHIEASENAQDGTIEYDVANYVALAGMTSGDLVLCRLNAPLVKTCYNLIRSGKKAVIRGRDIGKGLLVLIDKMKATSIVDLVEKIETYRSKELEKLRAKRAREAVIQSLNDRIDTVVALTDGVYDMVVLKSRIENMFSDKEEGIVCSSVHRAKGLEAQNVYILNPELMPFSRATQEWEMEQERNIMYVAFTRSKSKLVFIEGYPNLAIPELEEERLIDEFIVSRLKAGETLDEISADYKLGATFDNVPPEYDVVGDDLIAKLLEEDSTK